MAGRLIAATAVAPSCHEGRRSREAARTAPSLPMEAARAHARVERHARPLAELFPGRSPGRALRSGEPIRRRRDPGQVHRWAQAKAQKSSPWPAPGRTPGRRKAAPDLHPCPVKCTSKGDAPGNEPSAQGTPSSPNDQTTTQTQTWHAPDLPTSVSSTACTLGPLISGPGSSSALGASPEPHSSCTRAHAMSSPNGKTGLMHAEGT